MRYDIFVLTLQNEHIPITMTSINSTAMLPPTLRATSQAITTGYITGGKNWTQSSLENVPVSRHLVVLDLLSSWINLPGYLVNGPGLTKLRGRCNQDSPCQQLRAIRSTNKIDTPSALTWGQCYYCTTHQSLSVGVPMIVGSPKIGVFVFPVSACFTC